MKNKKILIVTDYYFPHWTGISKSIQYLTNSLRKSFDFTILTVKYNPKLQQTETIDGIKVIRENYLFPISRAKFSITLIFKFIQIAKKFDTVFINSPFTNILLISMLTKLFNKKLIIFHQGDLVLPKGIINTVLEKIFDASTYFAFSMADKVSTYNIDYAKNSRLLKFFISKFEPLMIPLPKRPRFKLNQKSKNKNFKKLVEEKKTTRIIFGFAGRFVEEKGFDILFNAIPLVIKKHPNSLFVFAGEVNLGYENFFENNIKEYKKNKKYIKLLGLLDEKKMDNFYKNIDFIVVPSRSDCFNLVQAEAMLYKVPAISSNIPGLRYLVNKTSFGLTFKKESSFDLADKILKAVNKKDTYKSKYKNLLMLLNYENNIKSAIKFFLS